MRRRHQLGLAAVAVLAAVVSAAEGALVAYYDFDAGNAADLSGYANHGAAGSAVTFSTDVPAALSSGLSAQFPGGGTTGIISVPTSPTLESFGDSLTVAFWIKMDHTANPNWVRVTRKGSEASGTQGWMITRQSNTSDLLMRTDTLGSGGAFNQNRGNGVGVGMLDGQWHHYVHIRDSGTWIEYVDGVQTGAGGYPHGNGFANSESLLIGGRNGQAMLGLLDDVGYWNQALPAHWVAALAEGASPASVPEPTTMLIWSLLAGLGIALGWRRCNR